MRDLLNKPAWTEEDLGLPLPDTEHAVSVCLPTWKSILDYEEGRERVLRKMRLGYPRFFRHPQVLRLFERARQEVTAAENESVVVFPTRVSAQRAQRFVERKTESATRIASFHGLQALVVNEKALQTAFDYWRFTGEVVSSRQAMNILDEKPLPQSRFRILRSKLAKIHGIDPQMVFVFCSGMAACTAVVRSLPRARTGKKTLQLEFPYVDCLKVQEMFGSGVVFLNAAHGESFDEAIQRIRQGEFAGVFTEVPSNPLLRTIDLVRVAEACQSSGTPLIVDDSTGCPGNVSLLKYADVVTTSLTKWVSGQGDVMAGMACIRESSAFAAEFAVGLAGEGAECSPLYVADAIQLLSYLKDLPQRQHLHNENGLALATYLHQHAAVEKIWYPAFTCREEYDRIKNPDGGYGALLSFVLKNPKKTAKFYDALAVCKGPSFGTSFTLACPYTLLAHYQELDWAEGCGVSQNLIRVSVGVEPIDSLLKTFAEALADL